MPNSPLPLRFVQSPPQILYDLTIPPEMRDTYLQLLGLAWNSEKEPPETHPMPINELEFWTGKKRSTIYGHLAFLRDRGKLRFASAEKGTLSVTLLVYVSKSQSKILDSTPLKDPAESIDLINHKEEIRDPSIQNSGRIQQRAYSGKQKEKPPPVPAETLRPIIDALADVTLTDKALNYSRLAKEAKALHLAGYTAAQVVEVYGPEGKWYLVDWRGQKGETPGLGNIRGTIKALLATKNGSRPATQQSARDDAKSIIQRRREALENGN